MISSSNEQKRILFVAGALNCSTAVIAEKWSCLVGVIRRDFGEVIEIARSPRVQSKLRDGVHDRSRLTLICAFLDAVLDHFFRLRSRPFSCLFYQSLLRRPTSIVLAVGAHPALCRTAKEKGVVVAELQHAPGGGASLNQYVQSPADDIPDVYIAFDQVAYATAVDLVGERIRVLLAEGQRSMPTDEVKRDRTHRRKVLIALQWGSYNPCGSSLILGAGESIPAIVREAVCLQPNDIEWVIRPHPRQLVEKKFRSQLAEIYDFVSSNERVSFDPADEALEDVISRFDVLVVSFSTSMLVAAQAGVPSIILEQGPFGDDATGRRIGALLQSGHAIACGPSATQLCREVKQARRREPLRDEAGSTVSDLLRSLI